jgi:hypothetical protein
VRSEQNPEAVKFVGVSQSRSLPEIKATLERAICDHKAVVAEWEAAKAAAAEAKITKTAGDLTDREYRKFTGATKSAKAKVTAAKAQIADTKRLLTDVESGSAMLSMDHELIHARALELVEAVTGKVQAFEIILPVPGGLTFDIDAQMRQDLAPKMQPEEDQQRTAEALTGHTASDEFGSSSVEFANEETPDEDRTIEDIEFEAAQDELDLELRRDAAEFQAQYWRDQAAQRAVQERLEEQSCIWAEEAWHDADEIVWLDGT